MWTGSAVSRIPDENLDVRTGRWVAAVGALAILLAVYVLHAALPATAFSPPGPDAKILRSFLPQGWAFFTKSPRSTSPVLYQHQPDGGWRTITVGPLARPQDAMGLDRMRRSQGTEVAMLIALVPEKAWLDCEQLPATCLSQAPAGRVVPNLSNHHSVCGEVGVVMQEVLPWAWRDAPTTMPSKVVRVRVTC